jgi:hypothetical protein
MVDHGAVAPMHGKVLTALVMVCYKRRTVFGVHSESARAPSGGPGAPVGPFTARWR